MSYWLDKIDSLIHQQNKEDSILTLEEISWITLTEFSKRDLAVEIYSEFLRCKLWFCSNDKMVSQIKKEIPGSICYTVDELRLLISLAPSPADLKKIHETKRTFSNSTIKESVINTHNEVTKDKEN